MDVVDHTKSSLMEQAHLPIVRQSHNGSGMSHNTRKYVQQMVQGEVYRQHFSFQHKSKKSSHQKTEVEDDSQARNFNPVDQWPTDM